MPKARGGIIWLVRVCKSGLAETWHLKRAKQEKKIRQRGGEERAESSLNEIP